MGMTEWAEREVRLALDKEITGIMNDPEETEDMKKLGKQYTEGCYQSALKAYKSILEDDHSGCSFSITSGILKKLIDGYPLTPIEDVPEVWVFCYEDEQKTTYQCNRCSSLFKKIDKNTNKIEFIDVESVICIGPDRITYHNGFVTKKIQELYPITMPYQPKGKYYVQASDFSTSGEPGTFDTMEIKSVKEPSGHVVILNWYFKEIENSWEPINSEEFQERYAMYKANQAKLFEPHEPK